MRRSFRGGLWVSSTGLGRFFPMVSFGREELERAVLGVLSEDCSFNGTLFSSTTRNVYINDQGEVLCKSDVFHPYYSKS